MSKRKLSRNKKRNTKRVSVSSHTNRIPTCKEGQIKNAAKFLWSKFLDLLIKEIFSPVVSSLIKWVWKILKEIVLSLIN